LDLAKQSKKKLNGNFTSERLGNLQLNDQLRGESGFTFLCAANVRAQWSGVNYTRMVQGVEMKEIVGGILYRYVLFARERWLRIISR